MVPPETPGTRSATPMQTPRAKTPAADARLLRDLAFMRGVELNAVIYTRGSTPRLFPSPPPGGGAEQHRPAGSRRFANAPRKVGDFSRPLPARNCRLCRHALIIRQARRECKAELGNDTEEAGRCCRLF